MLLRKLCSSNFENSFDKSEICSCKIIQNLKFCSCKNISNFKNYSKLEILCVTQFFGLTQNCGMGSSRIGSSNLSSGPGIGPGPGGIGPSGIGITGIVQFPISSGILISGPSSLSLSSSSGIMGKSFHHPSGNSHQPSGNFQPSGRSSQGGNRLPLSPSPESPSPSPELLSSLPETEISNFEFENNIEL